MALFARSAGALLTLVFCLALPAAASAEEEGATAAAPVSCVAAQFELRSYVIALRSGDVTSGARDPVRIVKAITPLCRQAIENGRWPGLASELLAHASDDVAVKRAICAIAPPEAWSAIAQWETAGDEVRFPYDVPCAVALFRHHPEDFAKLVVPRLTSSDACLFPDLAARLGEAVGADERIRLLPALDFATHTHAQGRDRLYEILCQHPVARALAACQAPAELEATWAHEARIKRATPAMAFHLGLAVLFALAACLWRYLRGKDWPAVGMSAAATAATAAAGAWILVSAPPPGAGALNGLNIVMAMVAAPVVALVGGLVAWAFVRLFRGVALPWCLLHAVVYGLATASHVWKNAWDRLC